MEICRLVRIEIDDMMLYCDKQKLLKEFGNVIKV